MSTHRNFGRRFFGAAKHGTALVAFGAAALLSACSGNAPSPLSGFEGYAFSGAEKIVENEDGTWIVSWSAAPIPGASYFVYSRKSPSSFDFARPVGPGITEAFYKTADLRYDPETCFVVRLSIPGFPSDTNTKEVCSVAKPKEFSGAKTAEIGDDGRITVSWTQVPQGRGSYLVRRIVNGSLDETVLNKSAEASATVGPFPLGQELCFQVQYVEPGFPSTANTDKACVARNLLGDFSGLERIASTDTEKVTLDWNPTTNSLVAGYNIYLGDDFKTRLASVPGRGTPRYTLVGQTKGRSMTFGVRAFTNYGVEDANTKTMSVMVTDLSVPRFDGVKTAQILPNTMNAEIKWSASPDAQSLAKYRIYKGVSNINGVPVIDWSTVVAEVAWDKTQYVVENLGDELRYSFAVRVVNDFGIESTNTNALSVVTLDNGAPVFSGIDSVSLDGQNVVVRWKAASGDVMRYLLYFSKGSAGAIDFTTPLKTEPGTSNMAILSGFQSGQVYSFAVRAEDSHGAASAIPTRVLDINVGLQSPPRFLGYISTTGMDEHTVKLDFYRTPDANISSYKIIVRTPGSTVPFSTIYQGQPPSGTTVTALVSGLQSATAYDFWVKPIDSFFNEGDNVAVIRGSTLDLTPPNFGGATNITPIIGSAKLSWLARTSTDIRGFAVYWSEQPLVGLALSLKAALPAGVYSSSVKKADGSFDADASSYSVSGLKKNTTYYFLVHAFDAAGNEDANQIEKSTAIANSAPTLEADANTRSSYPNTPAATITLTARDVDADTVTYEEISNTCPPSALPVRSDRGGGVSEVNWLPSLSFVAVGQVSNTCSVVYRVGDGTTSSSPVTLVFTASNRAPRNATAVLLKGPMETTFNRNSPLKCSAQASDDDGDLVSVAYEWKRNGTTISGATSDTLDPTTGNFTPGTRIQCFATLSDGHSAVIATSEVAQFTNTAPTGPTVAIAGDVYPDSVNAGQKVRCDFAATDADNDVLQFGMTSIDYFDSASSAWNPANLTAATCTVTASQRTCYTVGSTFRGKKLRCKVSSVTDGYSTPLSFFTSSTDFLVQNSSPTISDVSISPNANLMVGSILTCNRTIADADGDPIVGVLTAWTRENTVIAGEVGQTYTVKVEDRNKDIRCRVFLPANADGYASLAVGPVESAAVRYFNTDPRVTTVSIVRPDLGSLSSVIIGTTLSCNPTIMDPDGDIDGTTVLPSNIIYQWYKDDTPISGAANKEYVVLPNDRLKQLSCSVSLKANADGHMSALVPPVFSSNITVPRNQDPIFTVAPTVTYVGIAKTGTTLTCNSAGTYNDPDGDSLPSPTYLWRRGGVTVASSSSSPLYSLVSADRANNITCQLTFAAGADGVLSAAVLSSASLPVVSANSDPTITSVTLNFNVGDLYPGDELQCLTVVKDTDGDTVTKNYSWYRVVGGVSTLISGASEYLYVAKAADRNTSVICRVTLPVDADKNGSASSSMEPLEGKSILNRSPVIGTTSLSPEYPNKSDIFTCSTTATDGDADALTISYEWFVNNVSKKNDTSGTLQGATDGVTINPSDIVKCIPSVSDGIATVAGTSASVSVVNVQPTALAPAVLSWAGGGALYRSSVTSSLLCSAQFNDADGDTLTYTGSWYANNTLFATTSVVVGAGGSVTSALNAGAGVSWSSGQQIYCVIRANDGHTGGIGSAVSNVETVGNLRPQGTLVCKKGAVTVGDTIPVEVFAGNPVPSISCTGITDGDGDTPLYVQTSNTCATIVIDTSGNVSSASSMQSGDCEMTVKAQDAFDPTLFATSTVTLTFKQPYTLGSSFSMTSGCVAQATLVYSANEERCTDITAQSAKFGSDVSSVWADSGAGHWGTYTAAPTTVDNSTCAATLTRSVVSSVVSGAATLEWNVLAGGFSKSFPQNLSLVKAPASPALPALNSVQASPNNQPLPTISAGAAVGCNSSACTGTPALVALGGAHSCAVGTDSQLYCWGSNGAGQLARTTASVVTTAVPLSANLGFAVSGISAGGSFGTGTNGFTCAIRSSDGVPLCWGANGNGQLGNDSLMTSSTPSPVYGLSGVTSIVSGVEHSCAIDGASKIWCWGRGDSGRIGNNETTDVKRPTNPSTGATFLDAGATGLALGAKHTCAISSNNYLFCWGNNWYGQLGLGNKGDFKTQPTLVAGLTNVVQVAAGDNFTCALVNDSGTASVYCWGLNSNGQLGAASIAESLTPKLVSFGPADSVVALSAGGQSACATLKTGEVKCWGDDSSGQIGLGLSSAVTPNSTSPSLALALGYDGRMVVQGPTHTCILKAAGELYCFGSNSKSQLGLTATQDRPNIRSMPNSSASIPAPQYKSCPTLLLRPN